MGAQVPALNKQAKMGTAKEVGSGGGRLVSGLRNPPNHPKGRKEGPGRAPVAQCNLRRMENPLDPAPFGMSPWDSLLVCMNFTNSKKLFFSHFHISKLGVFLESMALHS